MKKYVKLVYKIQINDIPLTDNEQTTTFTTLQGKQSEGKKAQLIFITIIFVFFFFCLKNVVGSFLYSL